MDYSVFSTILNVNEATGGTRFSTAPLIKYSYFDDNNDGLIDRFNFKITFQNDVKRLNNIKLVFFFKYEFRTVVVGRMNTVAMVDIDTPLGASYIKIDGDLNLQQKAAIDRTTFYNEKIYRYIYGNDDSKNKEDGSGSGSSYANIDETDKLYSFKDIAKEYYSRDFSTYYDYDAYIVPMKNPKIVRLEVNINVPTFQKILHSTPLFTKIKFFWAQYVSILMPVAGIFYFIMQFVFRNHIVDTVNSTDIEIKKKKIL